MDEAQNTIFLTSSDYHSRVLDNEFLRAKAVKTREVFLPPA